MLKGKEIQYVKVGMFVFVALVIGMFMIFMIGSDKKVFESQYKLQGTFADISGLRIGAPIQLAGVNVGYVENIRFPKDLMKKNIVVTLKISKKYQSRIRADSVATINTQGLLGDKYIFVSVGDADQPELKDDDIIQTKEVVGLFALAEKGGEILTDLAGAAKEISKFFDSKKGEGGVKDIIAALKSITEQAEKGKGLIHALIYDPNGEEIMKDLAASMESIRMLLGSSGPDDKRRERMITTAQNISVVAANIRAITDKMAKGEGTVGGFINDPSIYNSIRAFFGKANRNVLFKTVVRATIEENDKQVLR